MMKYLLPIGVIYLILAIICVILIVKEAKKTNNKEDMTLIIISFLVPLIGLIIYAINVGKDKHIVDCALKGLKLFVKFLVAHFIVSVIVILLMTFVFNAKSINHTSTRDNQNATINELTPQEIENEIKSNSYVTNVIIREKGKSIYISITFINDINVNIAKEVANSSLDYFDNSYIEKCDFNFNLTSSNKSFEIIGYKSYNSSNIIWNN